MERGTSFFCRFWSYYFWYMRQFRDDIDKRNSKNNKMYYLYYFSVIPISIHFLHIVFHQLLWSTNAVHILNQNAGERVEPFAFPMTVSFQSLLNVLESNMLCHAVSHKFLPVTFVRAETDKETNRILLHIYLLMHHLSHYYTPTGQYWNENWKLHGNGFL